MWYPLAGTRQICKSNQVLHEATDDTLEHIHEGTGEPEALGMQRTMKTYNFVATLMMLSDVLPVLTCLSRALQAKTADFTLVASQLTYVQHSLQQIKEHHNDQEYLSTVHAWHSHRPCNWCCRSGDSNKRKFQQECAAALPGRGQQANQLLFQRYLGPLDCFQHLQSTEMPNRCPATAQIWYCRIGEAPKFYGETTEIEYEGNVFSTPADVDKTETRHEWKAFKLVIFEEKSLPLKELATLFLRSEANVWPSPTLRFCSPLPWCFLCLLQLLSAL